MECYDQDMRREKDVNLTVCLERYEGASASVGAPFHFFFRLSISRASLCNVASPCIKLRLRVAVAKVNTSNSHFIKSLALENNSTFSESGDTEPKPVELAPKPVELAKVILGAQTHSQASVSSPTIRFYRPGTELQIVRREGIWLEVSDPVTQERGWVLTQYLSSIESPTPIQVATESTAQPPIAISPKSNKRHRSARQRVHSVGVANADPWNPRWARRADRRRGFGLFMFRPLPRFAQR